MSLSREKIVKMTPVDLPQTRVLIVDRDSMSGDLLAGALMRDRKCAASAIQPQGLLQEIAAGNVELVVIGAELGSSQDNGLDLAQSVSEAYPGIPIVILLNASTSEAVVGAFRCGARGVFSRQQSIAEFLDCVDRVTKGCIWAGRDETEFLLESFKGIAMLHRLSSGESPALTERELQVVRLAATGKTNRTIASELCLSEHTVKNYLFRVFEKLGVTSRVELLFYLTTRGQSLGLWKAGQAQDSVASDAEQYSS